MRATASISLETYLAHPNEVLKSIEEGARVVVYHGDRVVLAVVPPGDLRYLHHHVEQRRP